jgi:hypothetical protein
MWTDYEQNCNSQASMYRVATSMYRVATSSFEGFYLLLKTHLENLFSTKESANIQVPYYIHVKFRTVPLIG